MKNTVIVISSNREIEKRTRACLSLAGKAGALVYEQRGCSDVSLARNIALSTACHVLRTSPERDVVLMVDDDMVWKVEDAEAIVSLARDTGVATSALYSTYDASTEEVSVAAQLIPYDRRTTTQRGVWVTGLGFLAIPAKALLELEEASGKWMQKGKLFVEFTRSGLKNERWWSEDYCLTERLRGVALAPFSVGHIKRVPLWPTDEIIAQLVGQLDGAKL